MSSGNVQSFSYTLNGWWSLSLWRVFSGILRSVRRLFCQKSSLPCPIHSSLLEYVWHLFPALLRLVIIAVISSMMLPRGQCSPDNVSASQPKPSWIYVRRAGPGRASCVSSRPAASFWCFWLCLFLAWSLLGVRTDRKLVQGDFS